MFVMINLVHLVGTEISFLNFACFDVLGGCPASACGQTTMILEKWISDNQ